MKRLLLLLACGVSVCASDITGVWTGQLPGRNNTFTDIAFRLVQGADGEISGKMYGDYGSFKIVSGKRDGERVEFDVIASEQRGNEINDSRFKFTGTLRNGEMELTRERQSIVKAGSGETVKVRNDSNPVVKLKQLTGR
ncbi:MAG: hypothetical protein FJW31_04520 [Acidobacteria bacterium]|nr:hypothetical protein [Acidobacteriota bacterium]